MSQSLAKNLVHLVYSTKHRRPCLREAIQPELYAYTSGILQNWDSPALVIGGVRVAFIARAAEASLSESRVQAEIRAERAERDKLEVERSSLSSPSRIAGIAEASMEMGAPKSVRYVTMDTTGPNNTSTSSTVAAGASPVERVFGAVMALSAGEAQSLLVGDLGLAGSR